MKVPFLDLASSHHQLADELMPVWANALESSAFIGGTDVADFEEQFASACGTTVAVGVANGTDALELILRAAGIGPGDEVIVPANTFVATAAAVVLAGARPKFCDVDPTTLLMTATTAEQVRTPNTAAVIPVHLFGQMVDCDTLLPWAERNGLAVVEDAAQAHLARWGQQRAGSIGLAAGFSFYPGKNLGALGDGGAVTTNDTQLANAIRALANHGRGDDHHQHHFVGRNSRLDAIQAAALSVKLRHLESWNEQRRARWNDYVTGLSAIAEVRPVTTRPEATAVHHLAVVEVPHREELRIALANSEIATGIHYPTPCHRHPAFASFADGPLEIVEQAADRIVSLPMFPTMTSAHAKEVCNAIGAFYRS